MTFTYSYQQSFVYLDHPSQGQDVMVVCQIVHEYLQEDLKLMTATINAMY